MRIGLLVLVSVSLVSCLDDPGFNQGQFATEAAKSYCRWVYACCDAAEQKDRSPGGGTQTACEASMTTTYLNLYQSADPTLWNGKAAKDCVAKLDATGATCPRNFDGTAQLIACPIVPATKKPGDFCSNTWECTTQFCKNGVCANPLPENMACAATDPCQMGLRCIGGKCTTLKIDGAQCVKGEECMTGACGAGQCVNVPQYTCDGKI
jgi:hypothetical protein